MVLGRIPVSSAARRVRVGIPVVLVPNRGDITRVGFEEEFWHRVHAHRTFSTDHACLFDRRVSHRQLAFVDRPTRSALKIVTRH
jgi:hypothetical protein